VQGSLKGQWWLAVVVLLLCGCAGEPLQKVVVAELVEPAASEKPRPRVLRRVATEAYASFAQGVLFETRSWRLTNDARRLRFLSNDRTGAQEKRRQAAELWVRARGALEQTLALDPQGVFPLRRLASALGSRGEFEQAAPYLERIVTLAPEDLAAQVDLARGYEATNRLAEALDRYRSALKAARRAGVKWLRPRVGVVQVQLRVVQLTERLQGLAAAVAPLAEALEAYPENRVVLREVERMVSSARKEEGFVERAEEVVPQEARGFGFYFLMGRIAFAREDWAASVRYLDRAIEAKPDSWQAYLQRCLALTELGQVDEALAGLEQAPRSDLEPGTVESLKGMLLLQAHRYEEAAQVLEEAVGLAGSTRLADVARYHLAGAYEQLGRLDDAVATLKVNLARRADNVESLRALGYLHMKKKAYAEALAALQQVVRLAPQDVRARCALAGVYDKLGQLDEAINMLEVNLTIAPDDADSLNALGYFYAEKSVQLGEAEKLVRRALSQKPDNGAYLDSLGWVFFKQGKLDEAQKVLTEAAGATSDPVIYEHLGDVYLKQDQVEQAARWWERALELDPDASSARKKLEALSPAQPRKVVPQGTSKSGE